MGRVFKGKIWSIDVPSSIDNHLHGGCRNVEKSIILLQLKKHLKAVMVILRAMCSFLKM